MIRALKIFGITIVGLFFLLVVIGSFGPDTSIYLGRQIPKDFINEIKSLNILDEDEEIVYFYSDALLDIKGGFYLLTNENVVLYSDVWEPPEMKIEYSDIKDVRFDRNASLWEDSYIVLVTQRGLEIEFPVSSEKNRDGDFFQYIVDKSNVSNSLD